MIEKLIAIAWKKFEKYERTLTDFDYLEYLDAREVAEVALSCVPHHRLEYYEQLP